jgi:predicted nucleic acid-binding protein
MTQACVLDASVVVKWWFSEDEVVLAGAAQAFLSAYHAGELDIHAPDLLYAEVGNVLWKATRLRSWPPLAARQAVRDLVGLGLSAHPMSGLLPGAFELAAAYGITVYDASYVALARRLGVPCYTADRRLIRAVGDSIPEVRELTQV